jgi:hypothetical protein
MPALKGVRKKLLHWIGKKTSNLKLTINRKRQFVREIEAISFNYAPENLLLLLAWSSAVMPGNRTDVTAREVAFFQFLIATLTQGYQGLCHFHF